MRVRRSRPALAACLPLALAFALAAPFSSTAAERPFASGSGMIRIDGEHRTFAFHAAVHADGEVRGVAELHNRTSDVRLHLDIDCLRIDGNVATFSGTHRHATDPDYDGKPFWFRVVDNGERNGDPPDEMTLVLTFLGGNGVPCESEFPAGLRPLEHGNVQVHP